ncbi:MAG TPA: transporter substrate-binding domain-containing protein [Candidatus Rifleibacterium sp.]|jgi:polar amino acid transport system substrate-binding protein|nr:transporter substrate-binding domain-containing protein [Candidatus Rifleibacterium sp.]HPW58141.1 transporter substrate-binding domain-containing protein [Candidatus Rifleibacterium sp.]
MKKIALIFVLMVFAVSMTAQAKDVTLIAGLSLPPYIIEDSNSGIEYDIIKEALAKKGHTLKMEYVPFVRVIHDYPKYDGAVTINEASGAKGQYSDVVITYQNYPISLKSKNVQIASVQDLKDKVIVAFQNANKYLGEEYAKVVAENPNYTEQGEQVLQVKSLYSGRADAIVSDINIFKYYKKQTTDIDTTAEIVYHEVFPGTDYKVLFNDAALRDEFNAGLKELNESGRVKEIIDSYIK